MGERAVHLHLLTYFSSPLCHAPLVPGCFESRPGVFLLFQTRVSKVTPTSTSADVSVPRPRTHDDRTGRVFPDHLIR